MSTTPSSNGKKKKDSYYQTPPETPQNTLDKVIISDIQSGRYYIKFYKNYDDQQRMFTISDNDKYEINGKEYTVKIQLFNIPSKERGKVTLGIKIFDKKDKYIYWKDESFYFSDPNQGIIQLGLGLKDYINSDSEDNYQKNFKQFVIKKISEAPPIHVRHNDSISDSSDSEESDLEESDLEDSDSEESDLEESDLEELSKSNIRRWGWGWGGKSLYRNKNKTKKRNTGKKKFRKSRKSRKSRKYRKSRK
jgi:hypothetical protein